MPGKPTTIEELAAAGLDLERIAIEDAPGTHINLGPLAHGCPSQFLSVVHLPEVGKWLHYSCGTDMTLYDTEAEADAALDEDITCTLESCTNDNSKRHEVQVTLPDTEDSVTVCCTGSTDDGHQDDTYITAWRKAGVPDWGEHYDAESALLDALEQAQAIADRIGKEAALPMLREVETTLYRALWVQQREGEHFERQMEIHNGRTTHWVVQIHDQWAYANDRYDTADVGWHSDVLNWQNGAADAVRVLIAAADVEEMVAKGGYWWHSPDARQTIAVIEQADCYQLVWALGDVAGVREWDLTDTGLSKANQEAAAFVRYYYEGVKELAAQEDMAARINAGALRLRVIEDELAAVQSGLGDDIRRAHHAGQVIGRYWTTGITWNGLASSLKMDIHKLYQVRQGETWPKGCEVVYQLVTEYGGTAGVELGTHFNYLPAEVEKAFAKLGYGPNRPELWILVTPAEAKELSEPEVLGEIEIGLPVAELRTLIQAIADRSE
ncbi:hypothetical protein [Streptomyces noursei]